MKTEFKAGQEIYIIRNNAKDEVQILKQWILYAGKQMLFIKGESLYGEDCENVVCVHTEDKFNAVEFITASFEMAWTASLEKANSFKLEIERVREAINNLKSGL